jgi:YHS domain-containing protein
MTTKKQALPEEEPVDPVCKMTVPEKSRHLTATYNGKRYYFCAELCRNMFEKNPEKYHPLMPAKRKGLWGRYLERLNKATDGKPPKCCH